MTYELKVLYKLDLFIEKYNILDLNIEIIEYWIKFNSCNVNILKN